MALKLEAVSFQGNEGKSCMVTSLTQNIGSELAKRKKHIYLVFLHPERIKMILAPKTGGF
jgi:hypothetical protein